MNPRLLLTCAAALAFATTALAQNPDQRPDQPQRPGPRPPIPPMQRQHDDASQPRDTQHHDARGDIRARFNHVEEAIRHLRAAGLNEPAENLEKVARELREQSLRQQGGSQADARGMEEMKREIRNLSNQVQELKNVIQNQRSHEQRPSGPADAARDDDRRVGSGDGSRRRPDGPTPGDRRVDDGGHRREGDHGEQRKDDPPGDPRKDAARDGAPRGGTSPDQPQRDAPGPRQGDQREPGPRDETRRDGAQSGPAGVGGPSELDRERFMGLSNRTREKFVQEMRNSRDKMMNMSPEERHNFMKQLFEKAEAEDKTQKNDAAAKEGALRPSADRAAPANPPAPPQR